MPESPASSRLLVLRDQLLHRFGKGGTVLLAVMAVMLVGAVTFAVQAEKPWGRTVQKRLEKQQPLQPKEYAVIGLWWAAVINAGVLTALLGTAGKWIPGKITKHESQITNLNKPPAGARHSFEKWMWAVLLAAVVFGTWERWPKLSQSFWNDEAYAIERFVHGSWEKQKDGTTVFEPVTWTDTLFENRNGNNHFLNSLMARLTLDGWRKMTGAPRTAFSEFATRLPQMLVGLGAIIMLFLLGREMGSPVAGLGAACLLALHPWHIRYAAEMRGYAMMIFFVSVALLSLARALRTGHLRWWLLFAASEALFLLSFPGALYVALVLNLVCFIELCCRRQWSNAGRLVAFNALGAVPVLQWAAPSVPQILIFLREEQPAYVTDVSLWLHDLGSVLATGWQYHNTWPETHTGTDWTAIVATVPVPSMMIVGILALVFVAGLVIACWRGTASRLIVVAPIAAAMMSMGMNLRPGSPMTVWYLIYLLIPTTLAVYLAVEAVGRWLKLPWVSLVLCAGFTLCYAVFTQTAAAAVRDHPRQPTRDVVAFVRQQAPDALTATFGVSDRQHSAYDPPVEILQSVSDLDGCIARSRAASKPLYVYYCSDEHGKKRRPEIYERVTNSGEFEKVAEFPGSEELWSYRVYRLKPAGT